MPSNLSLAVSSICCPSTSMANWSVSLEALSSGWPTIRSLLLSPATHRLLSFSQLTVLSTSLWSFSTNWYGCLAWSLSVSSSTKTTLSPSSWHYGRSFELIIWNSPANNDPWGAHCPHTLGSHLSLTLLAHIVSFLQDRIYTNLPKLHQSCIVWTFLQSVRGWEDHKQHFFSHAFIHMSVSGGGHWL